MALQALKRIDVARRDGPGDDLVPAHSVGFQRLVDLLAEPPDLLLVTSSKSFQPIS